MYANAANGFVLFVVFAQFVDSHYALGMSAVLEKLLGSAARVKIIRLFFLNPDSVFAPKDVSRRTQVSAAQVRKELAVLYDIGFVRRASARVLMGIIKKGRKSVRKKVSGFALGSSFTLFEELRNLTLTTAPVSREELLRRLKRAGRVKLVVLAGIFLKRSSRIDMLIVGDRIKRGAVERLIHNLEADIGKELVYAILDTQEFKYRLGIYDKFVRDILDYPHEVLLDKVGLDR